MTNETNTVAADGVLPPLTMEQFLKATNFPRSTISWMIEQPDVQPKPRFFRLGRRLFITVADANTFISELSAQGYTPRKQSRRSTKVVRAKGSAS